VKGPATGVVRERGIPEPPKKSKVRGLKELLEVGCDLPLPTERRSDSVAGGKEAKST
jgi:hypothetical protein